MSDKGVYVLGGWQSDFARRWSPDELGQMLSDAAHGALDAASLEPSDIDVVHIGNLAGELFLGQAHMGSIAASVVPEFAGLPTSRHEAACASGSVAVLAAMSDLEAGRYGAALAIGVEVLRTVPGKEAGTLLRCAALQGSEASDQEFPFPYLFSQIADEYAERYGIDHAHLAAIAELNMSNAKNNPNAQTRDWKLSVHAFDVDDRLNPPVAGLLRKQDCGRITDGCAGVVLASREVAEEYCRHRATSLSSVARIAGWGHTTGPITVAEKLTATRGSSGYVFPHVHAAASDALRRAKLSNAFEVDAFEVHDCFTISEYVAIDHLGLTDPGQSWQAIEDGVIENGGKVPINPSGGLLGLGHPIGATGVRMVLDASNQVTGRAGECQVPGARTVGTLNVGGSFASVVSFIVSRG